MFADYRTAGLSLKAHPLSFHRQQLNQLNVVPAEKLRALQNRRRVCVAGLVLLRQRPSTAKGITFVTLEDETGTSNLLVHQATWERYYQIARRSAAWLAHGRIETKDSVIHVIVERLEDLSSVLGQLRRSPRATSADGQPTTRSPTRRQRILPVAREPKPRIEWTSRVATAAARPPTSGHHVTSPSGTLPDMCGRFTLRTPLNRLVEQFLFDMQDTDVAPRFNIAPTQPVAAVRVLEPGQPRQLSWLRWGLIPAWAKDRSIANQLINARGETVAEKPSFRSAFNGVAAWSCPMDTTNGRNSDPPGKKQPYYIHLRDDAARSPSRDCGRPGRTNRRCRSRHARSSRRRPTS